VTRRDGVTWTVNLAGATTVQEIITRIASVPQNTGNLLQVTLEGDKLLLSDSSTQSGTKRLTVTRAEQPDRREHPRLWHRDPADRRATGSNLRAGLNTISLPKGPFLRVAGEDITLTVLGQTLTGNFAFEQMTTEAGQKVIRVGVSKVGLEITTDDQPILVLSNGVGSLLITPGGIAGELKIDAALNIPNFNFSASFGLAFEQSED